MITDTPFEQKWVLQGRLCGVWALDLQEKWLSTKSTREGASARSISKTLSPSTGMANACSFRWPRKERLSAQPGLHEARFGIVEGQHRQISKETQPCGSKPEAEPGS